MRGSMPSIVGCIFCSVLWGVLVIFPTGSTSAASFEIISPRFLQTTLSISDDGKTVTGTMSSPSGASVWTKADGAIALPRMDNTRSISRGISADGRNVVGTVSYPDGGTTAIRWTDISSTTLIMAPTPRGGSLAQDISADGSVVVGIFNVYTNDASSPQAFRWTEVGGLQQLGNLPGKTQSTSLKVSGDGQIITGVSSTTNPGIITFDTPPNTYAAFRWTTETGMTDLGNPVGANGVVDTYISQDGTTIVGRALYSHFDFGSVRWRDGTGWESLGFLPSMNESVPSGVSRDGNTIVGTTYQRTYSSPYTSTDDLQTAYIWDPAHGMRSVESLLGSLGVDLHGAQLQYASDVSGDGLTIVGGGLDSFGERITWIATVPEVNCVGLLFAVATALVLLRFIDRGRILIQH